MGMFNVFDLNIVNQVIHELVYVLVYLFLGDFGMGTRSDLRWVRAFVFVFLGLFL